MDRFQAAYQNISAHLQNLAPLKSVNQTTFEVGPFNVSSSPVYSITLTVTFAQNFPVAAPKIQVNPKVKHHWLDNSCFVTGQPRLNSWTPSESIGLVVVEVIKEFQARPPKKEGVFGSNDPIKVMTEEFNSAIAGKSADELDRLLTDEDSFIALLHGLPSVKNMKKVKKDLEDSNLKIASENIKFESALSQVQHEHDELSKRFELLSAEINTLKAERSSLSEKTSGAAILTKLKEAVNTADNESEEIASKFLSKKLDFDTFYKSYLESRTLYHSRSAKIEQLTMDKGKLLASLFPTLSIQ